MRKKYTKCCGVHPLWNVIGGIRLYKVIEGKRVFNALCSKCGSPITDADLSDTPMVPPRTKNDPEHNWRYRR